MFATFADFSAIYPKLAAAIEAADQDGEYLGEDYDITQAALSSFSAAQLRNAENELAACNEDQFDHVVHTENEVVLPYAVNACAVLTAIFE